MINLCLPMMLQSVDRLQNVDHRQTARWSCFNSHTSDATIRRLKKDKVQSVSST